MYPPSAPCIRSLSPARFLPGLLLISHSSSSSLGADTLGSDCSGSSAGIELGGSAAGVALSSSLRTTNLDVF